MVVVSGPTPQLQHLLVTEEDIKAALFNLAQQITIQDYTNQLVSMTPAQQNAMMNGME